MQGQSQHSLKNGTILNHYKIIRVLGAGGFGITYLAVDIQLGIEVVLKEYFPNEFAIRNGDSTIVSKTASGHDFSKGMQRFKEEAQVLAKFNHPSIVKILGYFEANNTAYFVMEYEEGIDLSQYIKQLNRPMTQEEVLSIMMPILEGLKEVHKYNYLHRDIKPGNILLRKNHSPVLIDFGASKLAIGEASKSVTSMLTEGYAPLEQYSTDIKQQGPYTDLYAVGAVIYRMIAGKVPPSAQTRSYALLQDDTDPYEFLMNIRPSGFDENFLISVDKVLSVKAKDRQQVVLEFQADIMTKGKELTNKPSKVINLSENEPSGLGGWLALIGLGLIISPINLIFQLISLYKPIFEVGVWPALTTPGSENYIASYSSLLMLEMIGNSVIILISFYILYLYFSQKESFIKWYIWASIGGLLFIILDALLAHTVIPDTPAFDAETTKAIAQGFISAVIWISYLLISKRAKNTFIQPDNNRFKPLFIMMIISLIITSILYIYLNSQPIFKQESEGGIKTEKIVVNNDEYREFVKELNTYNKTLPQKIDEYTTLEKVKVEAMTIEYEYSILRNLLDLEQSALPKLYKEMENNGIKMSCEDKDIRLIFNMDFIVKRTYYSLDNKYMFSYIITKQDCNDPVD